MTRVLVTGATGFIGGALTRRLLREGVAVTATGRNPKAGRALAESGARFVPAELTDPAAPALCCGHDVVVHAAARSSPWGPTRAFYADNVQATQHMVDGCLAQGARLVFVSSPSVCFDGRNRLGVREDDPLPRRALNAYAATKRAAEGLVAGAVRRGLIAMVVRPRAVFGPGDPSIFPRLLPALASGRLPVIGDGRNWTDFTYIDDAVEGLVRCLEAPAAAWGRTYHLSSGVPVQLWPAIATLCRRLGYPLPRRHVSARRALAAAAALEALHRTVLRGTEPPLTRYAVVNLARSQTLDIGAARRALGYVPQVDVDEGLQRLAAWWAARP